MAGWHSALTNKGIGYMRSFHVILGYDFLITGESAAENEIYYQHLFNIPVRENEPAYSMLNFGDNSFSSLPIMTSLVNRGTGNIMEWMLTAERFLERGFYFGDCIAL